MTNYKELIERLNDISKFLGFESTSCVCLAADAIEQLVKERDAAIADLTELSNDLQSCKYCKNLKDDICTYYATHPKEKVNCGDGKFFEWRGVQEASYERPT